MKGNRGSFQPNNSIEDGLGLTEFVVVLILSKNSSYFRNKEVGYVCSSLVLLFIHLSVH